MFFEMRFDLGTLDSGERSLPFGLLVVYTCTVLNAFCDPVKPCRYSVYTLKSLYRVI